MSDNGKRYRRRESKVEKRVLKLREEPTLGEDGHEDGALGTSSWGGGTVTTTPESAMVLIEIDEPAVAPAAAPAAVAAVAATAPAGAPAAAPAPATPTPRYRRVLDALATSATAPAPAPALATAACKAAPASSSVPSPAANNSSSDEDEEDPFGELRRNGSFHDGSDDDDDDSDLPEDSFAGGSVAETSSKVPLLRLELVAGPLRGRWVDVGPAGATIGASRGCTLDLTSDLTVCPMHATIAHADGAWYLSDVGSRDGTFLLLADCGEKVDAGDRLRVGRSDLTFLVRPHQSERCDYYLTCTCVCEEQAGDGDIWTCDSADGLQEKATKLTRLASELPRKHACRLRVLLVCIALLLLAALASIPAIVIAVTPPFDPCAEFRSAVQTSTSPSTADDFELIGIRRLFGGVPSDFLNGGSLTKADSGSAASTNSTINCTELAAKQNHSDQLLDYYDDFSVGF